MKVIIVGQPITIHDVDEVRWSMAYTDELREPGADSGKRVLYLEPGTEFVIDNRGAETEKA